MIHPYEREDTIARHELVKVEDGFEKRQHHLDTDGNAEGTEY